MPVQVIGGTFTFVFGDNAVYQLHFRDAAHLDVTVVADAAYPAGTVNQFDIEMTEIRPDLYQVSWIEPATGNTVTHIEDYENNVAWTNITDVKTKEFWRLKGSIQPVDESPGG